MKKKILAMLLVLVMVLGMFPTTVQATENLSFTNSKYSTDIMLPSSTIVGSATLTQMSIYEQKVYAPLSVKSVTMDGTTINVSLTEGTNLSLPVQVGFSAGSGYPSNTSNTCTLNNGVGVMHPKVVVYKDRGSSEILGEQEFTINFLVEGAAEPVSVTPPTGAGFTFEGSESAYADSGYTFKISVNEGYDGSSMVVKVNGAVIEGVDGSYTVAEVTEDIVITVEGVAAKTVYSVTAPEAEGVDFNGAATVYEGDDYSFTVDVDEAYDASSMVVMAGEDELTAKNGVYTVENVSEDIIITVTGVVKKDVYTVTLTEGEGYTLAGQDTSYAGEDYTFTVTVNDAIYWADDIVVKVNNEEVELTNGSYTIEALDGDKVVTVENVVERQLFTVTKPEVEGVTFTGADSVREGKPYTFSVAVDSAYIAANMVVKLNGEPIEMADGSYTVEAAAEDIEVTVEGVVKKNEYTVTKPTVEGVTVTGADTVLETDTYTFTVTVAEGYDGSGMVVKVNGSEVSGTSGAYTVANVAGNLTISIEGVNKKEVCSITAPSAGKFTFTGAESVYAGDNYTFTVTANTGYIATVKVNGEVIDGNNGSYTVSNVSEDIVITVEIERAPIEGTEIAVNGNVIDITDKTVGTWSSYYAKAVNISVEGVSVKEAYENGTTVYIVVPYATEDNAEVSVSFGTSVNRLTMDGAGKRSFTLDEGEGTFSVTLTAKLSGSNRGTATYTLIFIREEAPTQPPECVKTTDTTEVWAGHSLTIDLSDYFTSAGAYYLIDGENRTTVDGSKYTFVSSEAGEYTLVFAAANEFGESVDRLIVTITVKAVDSGIYIGHTTSNGSWDYVQFKDAEGNEIEGLAANLEGKTINVYLPKTYSPSGKVIAQFSLTQNGGLPVLTTTTATVGASQWNKNTFTNKTLTLSSGKASFTFYYCNQSPKNESATTWTINIQILNDLPVLADGVAASTEATITAGSSYTLDLTPIFTDVDEDALTYLVSINGAAAVAADANYSYTTDVAGTYTLVFTANDGKGTSTESYTVTLTVENATETKSMTASVPEDIEPEFYLSTGYDSNGIDTQGDEVTAVKGETADGLTAYTLSYPINASIISVRADGWGGMAFEAVENSSVSLRKVTMNVVDYNNESAESTNTVKYGGNTAALGGNGWLLVAGKEYTYTAVPVSGDLATVTKTETLAEGAEVCSVYMMLGINNPIAVTVTTGAEAKVYKYDTSKYYYSTELDAKIVTDNGDGTTTYNFIGDTKANSSCYIYHVTMDGKIAKAGYLNWGEQTLNVTYSDADKADDWRLDDYSDMGQENSGVAEDSVLLNINSRNHLSMNVGDTKTLKAYRAWEIVKISYQNYIITPDFTYTILAGDDVVSLTEKESPSTADGDWMTLTALKDGIAIIEVTYDAMTVTGGSFDGDYGASDPNRTGFVVVQVGGDSDASVKFGIDGFSSIGRSGTKNISYNPNNKKDWDAEFDTLYFTDDSGELNLTPTADSDILEVAVSNDKGESWNVLTDDEGVYTATIVPGNNILRVTTENGVAYQVVRGDKVTVTMSEQTGDGDGLYEAGETVRVTIKGLHTPVPKMAGNYNPGYYANTDGYSSVHLNYTCNDEAVWGPGTQYNFITTANYVDIVMPDDGSSAVLTDGYIGVGVMGLTAFADGGDSHRNIPDNGCGTRASETTYHTRSILPEIVVVNAAAEEAANQAAADAVKNLIAAIGEVSLEREEAITEARAAYNALTDAQKALVDNYSVLTEAEAALAQLKATNEDEEAADAVENLIAAIGEVSLEREEAIAEARAAYDALTDTQKALVENYVVLTAAEAELEALKKEAADKAAAAAVDALILAIEDVTLESENAITEAREAYDALSEEQKAFAENLAVLEAAEAALEALKKDAADKAAADEVEALIAAIGEVTLEKESAINAARTEYELLTAEQKNLVENYAVLTAAEAALAQLKEESDQPETPAGTVYISVSFDGKYVNNKNGAPVAYVPVSLAALEAVDLNAYGLSKYDFDGQLTALHLYIYVHENIMGLEWRNSYVSGGAGSIFFVEGLFGFEDCNLKYYYNGAYPEIDGWGTTADQLVLADGDFFDIAAYTSWSFYGDSLTGFHFFLEDEEITHNYSAEAGEKLTVTLGRSDIEMTKVEGYTVYYGKSFGTAEGSFASGSDGKTDVTFNKSGTWYLWVEGGYGASEENKDDIVSSPAYATVTVNGADVVGDDVIVHEETTPEQPEEPTTYTVTLPNGEGYTAAATEGSTSPVNEGGSYSFTVTVTEGYEAGESFAVKANGVVLTAVEGVYTIANITENQNVTVEGVVEKETEGGDTPDEPELSWQEVMAKTKAYLIAQATETAPVVASQYGEWAVLGLARGGVDAESEFFAKYYENVVAHVQDKIDENGRLHRSKSTDNSRVILALTALGKDVTNVGGHNLLKGLSNTAYVKNQGVNGPVWALIALDSADYEIPTDADSAEQVTREWLIAYILEKELEGGGWALSGSEPDDMTPMAVQALAPYYESDAEVKAAVDRALAVMETMSVTTETYAQIIVARSALGLDSEAALENMLTFALEDGTFRKVPNGDTNQMSTEQAFYAMVAYERYKNDENSLYDMSDVVIEDDSGSGSDGPTEPDDPNDPDDPGEGGGSGSGDEPEDEEEEKLIFGLKQEEIAGWVIVSFEDKGVRRSEELSDIEPQFRKPLGSIVPMTRVPFKIGDTVAAVTLRLLEEKGLTAYYQGSAFGGFYLEAIGDFTIKGTYYESFGEFDAGVDSGWMITWDDWFINEGASEFTVENNDLVKWQYTCQLGEDIGDPYWSEGGGSKEEDEEEVEEEEEEEEPESAPKDDTTVTVTPEATVSGDKATANVGASDIAGALEEAKKDETVTNVTISPEVKGEANCVSVEIPKTSVSDVAASGLGLTVETDIADVKLPAKALEDVSSKSGQQVSVSAEKTESGAVNVEIAVDGKAIDKVNGGVVINLPAEDTGKVLVIVNEDGSETIVKKSVSGSNGVSALIEGSATVKLVDNKKEFNDTAKHWGASAIDFATSRELFNGVSDTEFDPNGTMTRAMLVTVLYRLEGEPASNASNNFADVEDGKWYTDAVAWANELGIVEGDGIGFDPNGEVTREQIAVILHRYAEHIAMSTEHKGDLAKFDDHGETSSWAKEAKEWAVGAGLITGKDGNKLDPTGNATRAEVATILERLVGLMMK